MCNKFSVKCEKNSECTLFTYYRSLHINNFTQRLHTHTRTHTRVESLLYDVKTLKDICIKLNQYGTSCNGLNTFFNRRRQPYEFVTRRFIR